MTVTRQCPEREKSAAAAPPVSPGGNARWRSVLEARWRDRLQYLTEVCVAFYDAGNQSLAGLPHRPLGELTHRAVEARQAVAETDEALKRLAAGVFGRCEQCSGDIPSVSLLRAPESRHCSACAI